MRPTTIGSVSSLTKTVAQVSPAPFNPGSITLQEAQLPAAQAELTKLDFATIPSGDIITIGLGAEQSLGKTLDGFLARLDKRSAAQLFELFGQLQQGVDDANLPEIVKKIQQGEKPGFFQRLFGGSKGRQADETVRRLMEELGDLISGRTKTLADSMAKIEAELTVEMRRLFGELKALESLKKSYGTHFGEFTVAAAVAHAFLENARAYVAAEEAGASAADIVAHTRLSELRGKLRLLESRALALEGVYTRLPADSLVIQQIEEAGVATLQETATTLASRYASIKMTLLTIQGAFAVKAVQHIVGRQQRLDEQLLQIRTTALRDVAVTAASAPGDNRLAQAKQIEGIITSTRELKGLVATAQAETAEKFETARQMFAKSRQELASIAKK